MKRYYKILLVTTILLGLTGCGSSKEEIVNRCKLTSNQEANGYKIEAEYEVYSINGEVNKVVTKEVVTSDNKEILDYFEENLKEVYETQNNTYGGTTNKLDRKDTTITSTTTIDYNEMDLQKYVKDNTALSSYVNSNDKLKLKGVLNIYESVGAVCE